MLDLETLRRDRSSRRAFLSRMTAAGLGAAAITLLDGCSGTYSPNGTPTPTPSPSPTGLDPVNFPNIVGRNIDEVVLNFALTLEILEADLYRQALNIASGRARTAPLDSTQPSATSTGSYSLAVSPGGLSSQLAQVGFLYLVQYAYVEAAHRDFLRTALNSFGAPTATANPGGYTANFGTTLQSILETLYAVEEVGVRAYLGAAGFMTLGDGLLLTTAVAIHSTEARHSGAIAYVLGKDPGPLFSGADRNVINKTNSRNPAPYSDNTFQYYLPPATVLSAVRPFFNTNS